MISLLQARVAPLIVASRSQVITVGRGHCCISAGKMQSSQNRKLTTTIPTNLSLFFTMKDLMTNLFSWDLDFFLQSVFLR